MALLCSSSEADSDTFALIPELIIASSLKHHYDMGRNFGHGSFGMSM